MAKKNADDTEVAIAFVVAGKDAKNDRIRAYSRCAYSVEGVDAEDVSFLAEYPLSDRM